MRRRFSRSAGGNSILAQPAATSNDLELWKDRTELSLHQRPKVRARAWTSLYPGSVSAGL